ncbi:Hexose transporter 2 [Apiospora kogelbergensis]|uniref:Hexose transporter 2 n=1 Tax=Apiospora kogelbergensis TaxID=1337665 RepID=UPI003130E8A1
MPFLKKNASHGEKREEGVAGPSSDAAPIAANQKVTFIAVFLGVVASIGGFMFGYVSGQISGFFQMTDFARRFGELQDDGSYTFSPARQGTITGLLPVGCMVGALIAGKIADSLGRRLAISVSALWSCVGIVIEISSDTAWFQFAIGRLVTGMSIGALSVVVPMYQSESSPAIIRGVLVSTYQLFITLGIWTSNMVTWGTHKNLDHEASAAWRITNALGFAWALILGVGIMFLPESPRFAYRAGREEEARATIARLAGVSTDDKSVNDQITQIRVKLDEEKAGADTKWYEAFTGPRMAYRTVVGVVLQAGQQLTGANFFFYYGTTVFAATGLSDPYVTQIILGTVNVICTIFGLWVIQKPPGAGSALIVFSCLAIAAFAITWGPLVWAVVAELYPAKYRAPCMALATMSNWFWNFMISFFTRFITDKIDYWYGMVFAGCCVALVIFVFFFVIETKDRSLEEIDTMHLLHVNPITSAKWDGSQVPEGVKGSTHEESGHNSGAETHHDEI